MFPLPLGLAVFFCLLTSSLFSQNLQKAAIAPHDSETPISFRVSHQSLSFQDSIVQISLHTSPTEAVRLFNTSVKVWEGKNIQNEFSQTGVLLEDGLRIELPRDELFFTYHNHLIYTETFRQSLDGKWQFSMLRGYRIRKNELILQVRVLDTLKGQNSPKWYFADGQYILSPRAAMASQLDSTVVIASPGRKANQLSFKLINLRSRRIQLTRMVAIGLTAKLPFQSLKGFGVKEIHLTDDQIIVHSLYQMAEGPMDHLFSGLDRQGNVLWEKSIKAELVRRPASRDDFFILQNRPIIYQVLTVIHGPSGRKIWEKSLYDVYNTDPKFEYALVKPESLNILEISPLFGDKYLGVILGRLDKESNLIQDPILYLFDKKGRVVYRYELAERAAHWCLYSKDGQFHIANEQAHYTFKP